MKVSRVQEMRALDKQAVKEFGIEETLLMENAGMAAFSVIAESGGVRDRKFVIFCGTGNNGGDGLVVARKIHSNGGRVKILIIGERQNFKGAAKLNLEIAEKLKLEMAELQNPEQVADDLNNCDALIDAIFGTGLDREVGGIYRSVIERINQSGKTVYSLDIPSGINGDSGAVMGIAVRAHHTITFGLPKTGNLLFPGFKYAGKLSVTHISFPPQLYNQDKLKIAVNTPLPLPDRPMDAHKGSCGKALFIAGSALYFGAPYFAAQSFLKAGGGLSFLATPENVAPFIAAKGNEIVFVPLKASKQGSITMQSMDRLLEFADHVDIVVIGPGLSVNRGTQNLVRNLSTEISKPLLIDGDGLTAIAQDLPCIGNRRAETILTPHPGEMSRLTGKKISEIEQRRLDIAQATAKILGSVLVLKGAHTLIAYPDERVFINLSGNAGMATAGSGDVLTGTIAAMFGLGLPIPESVRNGVFVHGFAGDLAMLEKGQDGLVASDIMEYLPVAMKLMRDDYTNIVSGYYNKINVL